MHNIIGNIGNIGNTRFVGGNIAVSGQINTLGNIVTPFLFGNVVSNTGNVGNVRMVGGNIAASGQINALGNVVASFLLGDVISNIGNIGNTRFVGGNVAVSGQINVLGNVVAPFLFGNVVSNTGNVGNVRMVGGNVSVSGQVNVNGQVVALGNIWAPFFRGNGALLEGVIPSGVQNLDIRGNIIGDYANVIIGNIGNTRFVGGNVAVSGQINTLGNVVAPFFLGNVISNTGNIGNVRMEGGNVSVSGQVNVSGQVVALGNIWAPFFRGNGALLEGVIPSGVQNLDIRGNIIGDYANVITGNIGNTRFVGGNVAISGQINALGNVVAPFFLGNVIGDIRGNVIGDIRGNIIGDIRGNLIGDYANVIIGNIGNTRFVGGNVAVSGQINVLGNVVAPVFLGNVIGNFANIGNVRMEAGNITLDGNINMTRQLRWSSAPGPMLEYYVFAGGRSGLGQFGSATTRLYPYDTTSLIIGQYSDVAGTTATDYIVANSSQGVHIHRSTTFKNLQPGGTMTVSVLGNLQASANASIGERLSVTGSANIGESLFVTGNIMPTGPIQFTGAQYPNPMVEYYSNDRRVGMGVVGGDSLRLYTSNGSATSSITLGEYATVEETVATDFLTCNIRGIYNLRDTTFTNYTGSGKCNISVIGQVNATGNVATSSYFIGNNMQLSGQAEIIGNVFSDYYFGNIAFASGGAESSIPNAIFTDVTGNLTGEYANVIWGNIGNTRFMGGNVAVSGQVNVLGNIVAPIFLGNVIGNFGNIGNVRMEAGNVLANRANIANVRLDASNVIAQYYRGNGSLLEGLTESSRFLSVSRATSQAFSSTWANAAVVLNRVLVNSGITYNSTTGIVTLEGGITYRVTAQLGWQSSGGYPFGFRLVESVSQVQVGPGAAETLSTNFNVANPPAPVLDFLITPTVTTTYQLRTTSSTNAGSNESIRSDVGTFMTIVSVSSKPIVSQGGYTKVTDWNFGASTTAPTLATSATRHYAWAVTGKMMSIKGFYNQTATTGAAAGSGEYLLAMPGGYQIDTATTGVATVGDVLEIPIGQTTLSTGTGNRGSGVVLAYDSGNIKFASWSAGGLSSNLTTIGSTFFPLTSSALYSLYFSADIPIV